MGIIDDLIAAIDMEAQLRDIRMEPYWTAVLTRNCGWHRWSRLPIIMASHRSARPVSWVTRMCVIWFIWLALKAP